MPNGHIGIEYDGRKQSSYEGIEVCWRTEDTNRRCRKFFNSGNPPQDFVDAVIFCHRKNFVDVVCSSSVDHFTFDGKKYAWSNNDLFGQYMYDVYDKGKLWHTFTFLPVKGKKRREVWIQANGKYVVIQDILGDFIINTTDGELRKRFSTAQDAIEFITRAKREIYYVSDNKTVGVGKMT